MLPSTLLEATGTPPLKNRIPVPGAAGLTLTRQTAPLCRPAPEKTHSRPIVWERRDALTVIFF